MEMSDHPSEEYLLDKHRLEMKESQCGILLAVIPRFRYVQPLSVWLRSEESRRRVSNIRFKATA
jgi:hypothetical protein